MIETNTSTEYWQKGASLLTTDPLGERDVALPDSARVYMIAGTQHGGRAGLGTASAVCANSVNPHSPGPALRALVVALENWVTKGVAPPPSRVPTIADGTAVGYAAVAMPKVKGLVVAPTGNRIDTPVDWIDPPGSNTLAANTYGTRVSAVDADGNEVAGLRLPPIAVPLATHTGWNVYKREPGELCDRDGSYLPFARTKAERQTAGDPRPSLEERYGSRASYVAKVKAAADALVTERLLLPTDATAYVTAAEATDGF
jgi:Alpha/beta hydrolase domain